MKGISTTITTTIEKNQVLFSKLVGPTETYVMRVYFIVLPIVR